jgi:hypothetical protein
MQLADAMAIALSVGAAVAFVLGEAALAHAEDLRALYWLAVGVVSLRGAVQVGRPGARK